MATWAIGDVHGCYRTLRKLLKKIDFAKSSDRLWFTGDLVNRGPRSLEVLEWAADHDWRIESVLGNHDLHLLAVAFGVAEERPRDTLRPILKSSRQVALLDWLRRRPLAVGTPARIMVHAGVLPTWTVEETLSIAARLEGRLRGADAIQLLAALRRKGAKPEDEGSEIRALRVLALVRTLRTDGDLCREFAGPPEESPRGCVPWFDLPGRRTAGTEIVFGHWAAAGYRRGSNYLALDSGCAWGGALSAVRLDDGVWVRIANAE
ncbi:MAG: symmetrical bis(5'-nucleosyl)-tetraphosphatase [Thermoanaerobaculia bacterium]